MLDGGTAVPQPDVLASRSRLYPDSERTMGWDVGASGLKIVLDSNVPVLVERYVGEDVRGFLADHGLSQDDIEWYVAHPGGPKVLEAMQAALGVGATPCRSPGTRSPGSATCHRPRCCTCWPTRSPTGHRGQGRTG